MRFFKRFLRILAAVLVVCAIGLGYLYHLSTRTPGNYNPLALTTEQRAAAANRAEQKLPDLLNLVNRAYAVNNAAHLAQAAGRPIPPDATQPLNPVTVTFTQDELNAFLWKSLDTYKWRYHIEGPGPWEKYIKDPYISLESGELVLMGTIPEFGRIASIYFKPQIDDKGLLRCDLDRIRVGNLPFPEAMLAKHKAKITSALDIRLPAWQANAKMEPNGAANADASAAATGQFALQLLTHQPSPAVLFLPRQFDKPSKDFIPLRITQLAVDQGNLTLTVQPMDAQGRAALLDKIRQPRSLASK
jgi:uncharacterized protein YpmS